MFDYPFFWQIGSRTGLGLDPSGPEVLKAQLRPPRPPGIHCPNSPRGPGQRHEKAPHMCMLPSPGQRWEHPCAFSQLMYTSHTRWQGLDHHSALCLCAVAWELSSTQQYPSSSDEPGSSWPREQALAQASLPNMPPSCTHADAALLSVAIPNTQYRLSFRYWRPRSFLRPIFVYQGTFSSLEL